MENASPPLRWWRRITYSSIWFQMLFYSKLNNSHAIGENACRLEWVRQFIDIKYKKLWISFHFGVIDWRAQFSHRYIIVKQEYIFMWLLFSWLKHFLSVCLIERYDVNYFIRLYYHKYNNYICHLKCCVCVWLWLLWLLLVSPLMPHSLFKIINNFNHLTLCKWTFIYFHVLIVLSILKVKN